LSNIEYLSKADPVLKVICMLHFMKTNYESNKFKFLLKEEDVIEIPYGSMLSDGTCLNIVNQN